MTVLDQIAWYQGRRDEIPNQLLARELAEARDEAGIREIAENLRNPEPNIQSHCLKVLYEIGYISPKLIAGYCEEFLRLLQSNNNRLVWGSMIALAAVAVIRADELFLHLDEIQHLTTQGSVITRDNGIKILAAIASQKDEYREAILPYLEAHLESCRPKELPQYAESISIAVDNEAKAGFLDILEKRLPELSSSQTS